MSSEDESDLKSFQSAVKRSGYSLQVRAERKLKEHYDVSREVPYLDKDESKGRYVDLRAVGYIPERDISVDTGKPVIAHLRLSIECKRLPDNAWVVYEGSDDGFLFHDMITAGNLKIEDVMQNYAPNGRFPELFHGNSYAEFLRDNACNKSLKSNRKDNNLYEAIHTVTKAVRYDMESFQNSLVYMIAFHNISRRLVAFALFQAVIIFEGHLYGARLVGEEMKLQPIKYAKIPKRYVSSSYNETEGYIHIVSYNSLQNYLQLVRRYYWEKSDDILRSQELLRQQIGTVR